MPDRPARPAPAVAVIGEAIADAFVEPSTATSQRTLTVHAGGGPANTAVAAARLGVPTAFVGRIARGPLGALFAAHLSASGVDTASTVSAAEPASIALAAVDPDGRASYDFYLRGTADWQWTDTELAAHVPDGVDCVHTGSLALALPPGGPVIERLLAARRDRATISVDPNVRAAIVAPEDYPAGLARWARLAHLIRFSDEDLAVLAPGRGFADVCADLHTDGVRLVVMTRGADGAIASLDGVPVSTPGIPVDVVDTVGAGDAFTAGLLDRLWRGGHLAARLTGLTVDDVAEAMRHGVRVAALTCAARGADPPWAAQLA